MPTDPRRPDPSDDDDVYVVDTRRSRRPSPRSTSRASTPAGSSSSRPGPPPTQPPAQPQRPPRDRSQPRAQERPQPRSQDRPRPASRPSPIAAPPPTGTPPRHRIRKGRLAILVAGLLVLAWLAFLIWVPVSAWRGVARVDNVPTGDRPAATSGHNYLLVGTDSRDGLTAAQRKELSTGNAAGARTDTIILVHVPSNGGKSLIISLPRDSYVPIPGYGSNKINAAYAFGGPKLLTETVEQVTGIHIDGYLEIGLGGFASMVDALDGVYICVPRDMDDPKAGINLKKGCQVLDGKNALGYVRARYSDPLGDLGRAARQRQFLGAVMKEAATPSTVLLPWRYRSFVNAATSDISVGEGTGLTDAYRILTAMRGVNQDETLSLTVPIETANYPTSNAGIAVKWDTEKALALFQAIKEDKPLTEPPAGTTIGK